MFEMLTEYKFNGIEATILQNKVVLKAYYSDNNAPIKNLDDIRQELEQNDYLYCREYLDGNTYLEDYNGYRYNTGTLDFSNEFDKDMKRLMSGELKNNKIEYDRDLTFLRPHDIKEYAEEGKLFDIDDRGIKYECDCVDFDETHSLMIFKTGDGELRTFNFEETHCIKLASEN